MAFNPDAYLAKKTSPASGGGFDPDAYIAQKSEQAATGPSSLADFGTAFKHGAALGAGPFVGGLGAGITNIFTSPRDDLSGYQKFQQGFEEGKQRVRQELQDVTERSPGAALSGQLAAGLAAAPALAVKGFQAMGAGQKVLQAGRQGAVRGGLHALGNADTAGEAGKDIAIGGLTSMGFQAAMAPRALARDIFQKSTGVAPQALQTFPPREAVTQAGQALGIKPTRGMLTQNITTRGLESSLEQSPTLSGELVRRQVDPVRQAMGGVVDKATGSRVATSSIEVAESVKEGIKKGVLAKSEPLKKSYEMFAQQFPTIPVRDRSVSAVVRNLNTLADDTLVGSDQQLVKGFAGLIAKAKSVDQLKQIRTSALTRARNGIPSEQMALSPVIEKTNRLIDSSILRAANDIATEAKGLRPTKGSRAISPELEKLAKSLVGEFKTTSRGYRELMEKLTNVAKESGISKKVYGVGDFLDKLDDLDAEKVMSRLFKTGDIKFLRQIKSEFPDQWTQMRDVKLQEIFNQSLQKTPKGTMEPSPVKFLNEMKKYSPEAISELFGETLGTDPNKVMANLQTLVTSFPNPAGPSGTPAGTQLLNLFFHPKEEIKDFSRLIQYQGSRLKVPKFGGPSPGKLIKAVGGDPEQTRNILATGAALGDTAFERRRNKLKGD